MVNVRELPDHPSRLSAWPRVSFEARPWVRDAEVPASRRAKLAASGDYRASVPAFIANTVPVLASDVQAHASDASQALTRFDAEMGAIAAPFIGILLRTESASSSEIENLTSSAKQVALAEIGAAVSENAKLVVANVGAMNSALQLAGDLDEPAIIKMQEALLYESCPDFTGRYRDQQVWIGGGAISPHQASFVPPHHERVAELMVDLVSFIRRVDIPVLAHAAIAHAQFETIHPFPDGNGRTGRALIHSMLRRGELTKNVAVPVSAGLLSDTGRYFDALTAYREGDVAQIVTVVADAAFLAVRNGGQLVEELKQARGDWDERITARRGSGASRLKDLLLKQPVVSVKIVQDELAISQPAAQQAIDRFVEAGVLAKTNSAKRNRFWVATEVLTALDEFGARARSQRS